MMMVMICKGTALWECEADVRILRELQQKQVSEHKGKKGRVKNAAWVPTTLLSISPLFVHIEYLVKTITKIFCPLCSLCLFLFSLSLLRLTHYGWVGQVSAPLFSWPPGPL